MDSKNFATTIRRLRKARGLSSAALARAANLSPAMLSRLERSEREPSLAAIRAIGRALHVPPGLLLLSSITSKDLEHTLGRSVATDALQALNEYLARAGED